MIRHKVAIVLGLVVLLTLSGAGVSFAYFSSGVTASGTATAGTLTVAETVSPTLAVTYNGSTSATTTAMTITNTGSVGGNYTTAVTLGTGSGASTTMATDVALVAWPTSSTGNCTASAVPVSPVSGTLANPPSPSGTLAAGASVVYCLRTTMTSATGVSSNSTVVPIVTTTLSTGPWSSSAAQTATQTFVDDVAPSVPGNLVLAGTTSSSVTLSWDPSTDNVGVTGYTVYRGTTKLGTVTGTSYTDSGLTIGSTPTTYSYTVVANDAAGNSSVKSTALSVSWPVDLTGWYHIVGVATGMCVDVNGAATSSGTNLIAYPCKSQTALDNQAFRFDTQGGYYQLVAHDNTDLVWTSPTPRRHEPSNGSALTVSTDTNSSSQEWTLVSRGNGAFAFQNRSSGLCLTMPTSSTSDMTQQTCSTTSTAQQFTLMEMP